MSRTCIKADSEVGNHCTIPSISSLLSIGVQAGAVQRQPDAECQSHRWIRGHRPAHRQMLLAMKVHVIRRIHPGHASRPLLGFAYFIRGASGAAHLCCAAWVAHQRSYS